MRFGVGVLVLNCDKYVIHNLTGLNYNFSHLITSILSHQLMTSSLTESDSSSNKVDNTGKNEAHNSWAPESSNIIHGSLAKAQVEENTNRSAAQIEGSPEPDFLDEPLFPLREGYTRRLIKKKYAPLEMWDIEF